jgi:signal transduction histidine kinase
VAQVELSRSDLAKSEASNVHPVTSPSMPKADVERTPYQGALNSLLTVSQEPLLIVDKSLKVRVVNESFNQHFTLSAESIEGKPIQLVMQGWSKSHFLLDFLKADWTQPHKSTIEVYKDQLFKVYVVHASPFESSGEQLLILSFKEELYPAHTEELKFDFFNMISHELKTPVMSIHAYSEMLGEMLQDKEYSAFDLVTKMREQVMRLSTLIKDIMDMQRLHSGQLSFQFEPFDFHEFLKDVVNQFQHTSKKHVIELRMLGERVVSGDRQRLRYVIENLLSNGIKYSPDSEQLLVTTSVVDKELVVNVRDYGIGISPDEQSKIFNCFFKTADTASTYPGIGIGLFMSSEIIRMHNGTIGVQSKQGEGSNFFFTLPLV